MSAFLAAIVPVIFGTDLRFTRDIDESLLITEKFKSIRNSPCCNALILVPFANYARTYFSVVPVISTLIFMLLCPEGIPELINTFVVKWIKEILIPPSYCSCY